MDNSTIGNLASPPPEGRHNCHWPGCSKAIPPKLLMCPRHWKTLPPAIRSAVWDAYRPGQEIDKNPSRTYIAAARAAQEWALDREQKLRARS